MNRRACGLGELRDNFLQLLFLFEDEISNYSYMEGGNIVASQGWVYNTDGF